MSQEQASPESSNKGFDNRRLPKSRFWRVATLVVEGGAICYFFWITADLFSATGRAWWQTALIFGADVFLILHIAYGLIRDNAANKKPVVIVASILLTGVLAGVIYKSRHDPKADDYIPGTEIARKEVERIFPFGYAVFLYGKDKIIKRELFKNGRMEWKVDVDKVTVEPDFYTKVVRWSIPGVSADSSGNGPGIHLIGPSTVTMPSRLEKGYIRAAGFDFGNKPILYVGTLDDDQRFPVFAIGLRIPTQEEMKSR